jgi:hypothetical protein
MSKTLNHFNGRKLRSRPSTTHPICVISNGRRSEGRDIDAVRCFRQRRAVSGEWIQSARAARPTIISGEPHRQPKVFAFVPKDRQDVRPKAWHASQSV